MDKPEIAAQSPAVLELEPGNYFWCACGRSENQPWCDGSHQGTDFTPVKTKIAEQKQYALCQCKRTGKQPFCDGTHNQIGFKSEERAR